MMKIQENAFAIACAAAFAIIDCVFLIRHGVTEHDV